MPLTLFQALELEDAGEVEKILLERPNEASLRDAENRTPLHYASEIANADLFRKVFDADSSLIDAQDASGFTPLFVAVTSGNVEVLKVLIEKRSHLDQVDLDKHTVIHWAVVCGQLETLQELINNGAQISTPDLHGAHPLHYSVTLDDVPPKRAEAILNALLRATPEVDCRDADDRTPFLWAASCGNSSALQRLIEAGANKYAVDRDSLNGLHCAANHGYVEAISLLLKQCNRKVLEGKDKNGDTPLFYAATFGHYDCAHLLLENNADPNHVDKRLRTPAHCAAAKGQMRILKLLRQFGASFDMQNYRGDLPFHEAVQTGNTEVVNWLLDLNPSNLNVGNYYGRTGLHLSAANGDLDLVRLLCEDRGAQTNALMIFRNQMCTSLDLAKQRQHQLVVDYLTNERKAQVANEMPTNMVQNERSNIEENVKSAKIRWNQARTTNAASVINEDQNGNYQPSNDLNKKMVFKIQRRSSSLVEDGPHDRSAAQFLQLLPKSTSTTDLRLPPIEGSSSSLLANKEAQTEEEEEEQLRRHHELGRELVEEAIRKVVGEESWKAITNLSGRNDKPSRLPKISDKGKKKGKKKNGVKKERANGSGEDDEDYPQLVGTDDERAFNNYYSPALQKSHLNNNKKVTVANEGSFRIRDIGEENDEDDDDFDIAAHAHQSSAAISRLLQNGSVASGTTSKNHFVHEKAIFHELTHLKRIQIQYGKVQERVLVRSLISNFCKMHGLNPAHFRYNSFYAWEKFLYDQLKLIYLEERDRIAVIALGAPHHSSSSSASQFERRLRKVSPLNERLRELTRIYSRNISSPTAMGSLTRTTLSRHTSQETPLDLHQHFIFPPASHAQHGPKNWSRFSNNRSDDFSGSDLLASKNGGGGKRCACLEEGGSASRSHSHLLLNNV